MDILLAIMAAIFGMIDGIIRAIVFFAAVKILFGYDIMKGAKDGWNNQA